jgi:hypothetical protein
MGLCSLVANGYAFINIIRFDADFQSFPLTYCFNVLILISNYVNPLNLVLGLRYIY